MPIKISILEDNEGLRGALQSALNNVGYHVRAYESVELGFPNRPDPFILAYAEEQGNWTGTVYGYVPASLVKKMIAGHGGIIEGECPPLV